MKPSTWPGDLLGSLTPPEVSVCETSEDVCDGDLVGSERLSAERFSGSRLAEFATCRACARAAMAKLGHAPREVPVGKRREPIWPEGLVGSITHCSGFRAAVVAPSALIASVGIDAEPNAPAGEGVRGMIMGRREEEAIAALGSEHPGIAWDRLLFSAKESVYKAWYPIMREWLGFYDCTLLPSGPSGAEEESGRLLTTGTFRALLSKTLDVGGTPVVELEGSWAVLEGTALHGAPQALVATAVVVEAP